MQFEFRRLEVHFNHLLNDNDYIAVSLCRGVGGGVGYVGERHQSCYYY